MNLNDYKYVDLILGKECQTKMGRGGVKPLEFKTFSQPMQEAITAYCGQGGNIFVSGAYVGTDLWDNRLAPAQESDKKFATEVLKYKWRVGQAATEGKVKCVASPFPALSGNYTYHNELNADSYVVESPDAIEPATKRCIHRNALFGKQSECRSSLQRRLQDLHTGLPVRSIAHRL